MQHSPWLGQWSRRSSSIRSSRRRSSERTAVQWSGTPTRQTGDKWGAALFFSAAFVAAATGLGVYLALCYSSSYCMGDVHEDHGQVGTMRPLLQMIWTMANMTFNPCSDFYQYACYNYHQSLKEAVPFKHPLADRIMPGLSQSNAGRALLNYHKACLTVHWHSRDAVKSAAQAILEMLYVDSGSVTPLRMFALMVKLNLVYDVHTDPSVHLGRPGGAVLQYNIPSSSAQQAYGLDHPSTFSLVADPPESCALSAFSEKIKAIYSDVLEEVTSRMGVNVTFHDFIDLSTILCSVVSNASDYIESRSTTLDRFLPGVSSRLWAGVVEEFTGRKIGGTVIHSPVDVLRHRFTVLTDRNSQPVALAFVLVRAAVELILESENTPARLSHEYCEKTASQLLPLWSLGVLFSFSPKTEHNQVIISTFDALVQVIHEEVREILEPEDALHAEQELRRIRPLLPYHVYPLELQIPRLGNNHFVNLLYVREYRLISSRYRTPSGIPQSAAESITLLYPTQMPGYVTIPLGLYTAIKLEPSMALRSMALIGLAMADNLWTALFEANWTDGGQKVMSSLRCNRQVNRPSMFQRSLKWPLRALVSCIRALSISDWHKNNVIWGQWSTSLSQVFYHLAVIYFYCRDTTLEAKRMRSEVAEFLYGISDFLEAFGCPRQKMWPICV
ncbi:hypothetical protein HPB49_010579 [Dermacentor silvarum]|uniref:Uncharacterized protein n=1 Tax=Dermacentor silvarum TaxID=543639 RepID=A0ACB8DD00_DERSI|nr:hypothetical protein HPB49_010579 [Dermacentor silvarum]